MIWRASVRFSAHGNIARQLLQQIGGMPHNRGGWDDPADVTFSLVRMSMKALRSRLSAIASADRVVERRFVPVTSRRG